MEYIKAVDGTNIKIEDGSTDKLNGFKLRYNLGYTTKATGVTNIYDYSFRYGSPPTIRCSNGTTVESNGLFTMTTTSGDSYIWQVINSGNQYNSSSAGQLFEFENDVYILKISDSTMSNHYITYYDENKISLGYINKKTNVVVINKNDKTGAKYFSIRIGQPSSLGAGVTHTFTIQLTTVPGVMYDYIPYGKYLVSIKHCGKNLLDINEILSNGLYINPSTGELTINTNWLQLKCLTLKSNTSYTLSSDYTLDDNSYEISFFDKDFKWLNTNQISLIEGYTTFTTNSEQKYMLIGCKNSESVYNHLQLEENNTLTVYEQYKGNDYLLDFSSENILNVNNVLEGASVSSNNEVITNQSARLYYIAVNSGETYTLKQGYSRQFVYAFSSEIPQIGSTTVGRTVLLGDETTVQVPENNNYMLIREYDSSAAERNETLIVCKGETTHIELRLTDSKRDAIMRREKKLEWYISKGTDEIDITNKDLISALNSLNRLRMYYGLNHIIVTGDMAPQILIGYNNWNKYINPSDRQALLDGTATIETKIVSDKLAYEKVETQLLFNHILDTTEMDGTTYNAIFRMEYIPVNAGEQYKVSISNYYIDGNEIGVVTTLPTDYDDFEKNISDYIVPVTIDNYTTGDIDLIQYPKGSEYEDESYTEAEFTVPSGGNYIIFRGEYIDPIYPSEHWPFVESLPPNSNSFNIYKNNGGLTQDNSIISWNHEDFRYVKDQGWIGQFVARQLTGELKNISDNFNITDEDLELQLGVRTNDNTNWYSLGNFLINKVTDDEVNDKTSFEALDYTKKFNKPYEDRMTYPCTASELAQDVCDQCGVELGDITFLNCNYVVEGNVFNNNETCRDVMKAIGKLAFSWVRVDWDNKVYFDFYKQNEVNEFNKANNSKYYNLKTQKEKFGPVNRIIIGYSQIEGERTKIEDGDSIDANGLCELTIYDNPLVYTQEQRESIIASASDLLGLEYMPLNTLTVGHPWLQGDDLFEITDMEGNTFNTIPFDRTIQYFGHIKTAIDVVTATKTNTKFAYESDIAKDAHNAEIQVNKVTGEITALTSRTTVVENAIKNTYTMEQTNELVQNAEHGVTNTFSESGGNNIFRNTGLWFTQSDENNPYEYWDGNVEQIKEEKASNHRGMLLKQGTLYQEQIVPNGNYTISFKYKKLINLANVKCVINDIEYPLTSTNDTEFVQTIEVSSQHINVKFITDIDDSCEIYDLMVNTGTVKLAYSQNQNETTTDTVNISKGITITSTDTDTTFKANADGIRTLDRNGNELTKFTDTGMTTKKMIVEDTSEIVGLLVQQVGNQTWFTKL